MYSLPLCSNVAFWHGMHPSSVATKGEVVDGEDHERYVHQSLGRMKSCCGLCSARSHSISLSLSLVIVNLTSFATVWFAQKETYTNRHRPQGDGKRNIAKNPPGRKLLNPSSIGGSASSTADHPYSLRQRKRVCVWKMIKTRLWKIVQPWDMVGRGRKGERVHLWWWRSGFHVSESN